MEATLEVIVVAPPAEMTKAGEDTHVMLARDIKLYLPPSVGMKIGLSPDLKQDAKRRYASLIERVSDSSGHFEIESVAWYPKTNHFVMRGKEYAEPTAEKFLSCLEFLMTFYRFTRSK